MEEIWINEFICTTDIIPEYKKKLWHDRLKVFYVFFGIMYVVLVVMEGLQNSISLWVLSPLFFVIFAKVQVNSAVKRECEGFEVLYGSRALPMHIEVGKYIYFKLGEKEEYRLFLSDIRKVLETKNFILLCFKGNLRLPLYKQGFIKGEAKTCIAYLKSEMKSR